MGLFLVLPPPVVKVPGIGTQAFIELELKRLYQSFGTAVVALAWLLSWLWD
jgi:hypothetical protein